MRLEELGLKFEAVLVNPPWNYSDPQHPLFTFTDFVGGAVSVGQVDNLEEDYDRWLAVCMGRKGMPKGCDNEV